MFTLHKCLSKEHCGQISCTTVIIASNCHTYFIQKFINPFPFLLPFTSNHFFLSPSFDLNKSINMLANLPIEILARIQLFLTRKDLTCLSITCRNIYGASLPSLYEDLELGYYRHIRQLQQGITSQSMLRKVINEYTRRLTLRSRQNGNNWRAQDLLDILGSSSRVKELIFSDFSRLSIQTIRQIISILPNVQHVQFRYCHIVDKSLQQEQQRDNQLLHHSLFDGYSEHRLNYDSLQTPTENIFQTNNNTFLDRVTYVWTDFTERSIAYALFPQITRLELGSNRNKYDLINDSMVRSLYRHYPKITHLTITLPQVGHKALCDTITQYGKQLAYLSIRCDHTDILLAIAAHARNIQNLVVRTSYGSPPSGHDEQSSLAMVNVIEHCQHLEHFEIISCNMEDHVPDIIWVCCLMRSNDFKLCFRAQTVLSQKREKRRQNPQTPIHRPSTRGSVWFFTVTEEILEQRYRYMNAAGLRQKNDILSNYTNLILDKSLLGEVKNQIKLQNEGWQCQSDEHSNTSCLEKLRGVN